MAKRMRVIKEEAHKRRVGFLKEFNKLDISIAEFAEMKNMTSARMWQILTKAKNFTGKAK